MARKPAKKEKKPRCKADQWLTKNGLLLIGAWARDEETTTDEKIAKKMGIARSTLSEWKKKYPQIDEALKKNKAIVDIEVENGLLDRAKGFKYVEEVPMKVKKEFWEDGHKKSIETVEMVLVTRYVPAETKAAQCWLYNRMPDKWKANREDEQPPDNTINVVYAEEVPQEYGK